MRQKTRNLTQITFGLGVMVMKKIKHAIAVIKFCVAESLKNKVGFVTGSVTGYGEVRIVLAKMHPAIKMADAKKGYCLERDYPSKFGERLFSVVIITLAKNAVTIKAVT